MYLDSMSEFHLYEMSKIVDEQERGQTQKALLPERNLFALEKPNEGCLNYGIEFYHTNILSKQNKEQKTKP